MYSITKGPRMLHFKKQPNCKEAYYTRAEKTSNNENLSQAFTKARRKTIIAFNQTDNANCQYYEVRSKPDKSTFCKA